MSTSSDTFSCDANALATLGDSLELIHQSGGTLADYTDEDRVRAITDIFALAIAADAVAGPGAVHPSVRPSGHRAVQLQLTTCSSNKARGPRRADSLAGPSLATDELLHGLDHEPVEHVCDELVRRLVNAANEWVGGLATADRNAIDIGLAVRS